ncbi:hypothetical protein B0T17DRAFT_621058 [Bombardia bombarda]|uniref:NB-ARC domain-containing protein n=1 Tax=Bombardia bombarda TaxID=252184 RepID=A0AA39U403_9PEZI|nr:hypothetical protein B0T17DRAFT_621058 [Bombardia bombarda]
MAGVGKTQIALEFARADDFDVVVWYNADSDSKMLGEFAKQASYLNLPVEDRNKQSSYYSWLAVFDNVDDFSILEANLPVAERGSILITGRQSPHLRSSVEQIEIPVFPAGEAEELLISLVGIEGNESEAGRRGSENVIGDLPRDPAVRILGRISETRDDIKEALKHHTRVLDLKAATRDPSPYAAQFKVAYCLKRLGRLEEAGSMISSSIIAMREKDVREDAIARALYLQSLITMELGDSAGSTQQKTEAAAIRTRLKGIDPETDDNLFAYTRLVFFWDW